MCSKAPHGTTPTLTSAIKISSQTATYINSRHYSLSWLITQSENKVSWHHKVSQGPTRSHKVAQGLTRSHKVSQGLKRSHKAPQGLTRPHKVSQGLTRPHRVSRGDSQVCSFSVWPLLGTLYHTYVAKTLHTAGNSIESQHGLLVIQWSPSMACWSSQLSVHSLIVVPAQRA